MEWMILPFKRYADFTGRSRRMEYWMFFLLNFIVALVLLVPAVIGFFYAMINMGQQGGASDGAGAGLWFNNINPLVWVGVVLYIGYSLASFIPWRAVSVRRFHDKGISGWVLSVYSWVRLCLGHWGLRFIFSPHCRGIRGQTNMAQIRLIRMMKIFSPDGPYDAR